MRSRSLDYCCTLTCLSLLLAGQLVAESKKSEGTLWSLRPLARVEVPKDGHPIDAFIQASALSKEQGQTARASRRALVRRASYGLTGLPPDPEMVEAFVADARPAPVAFRDVCEGLLESYHYGEHWGRHWLDVVRYADTAGENSDHPLPHAWRYRNWVIDAFNEDKPYDQFVRDQIAGDLLGQDLPQVERNAAIIATGYLAISRRFGHDIDKRMYLMYEDAIDNLGKAFLGLTISCARCHDHKHDPIAMHDYYALYGVFDSTRFSFPGCEPKQQPRDLIPLASESLVARKKAWEERQAALDAELNSADQPHKSRALKTLAGKCYKVISQGEVPEGRSAQVTKDPVVLNIRKGEAIQLSISPLKNHGADTTIVDFSISHASGGKMIRWSVKDHFDDFLSNHPVQAAGGAAWCFLDTGSPDPRVLNWRDATVSGHEELSAWTAPDGGLPSVLINASDQPVQLWHTLPPRTFFCHPSQRGAVAIAWLSPVDGTVTVDLTLSDGHPGGPDGVGWLLEHFADTSMARAYRELCEVSVPRAALVAEIAAHAATGNELTSPVAYAVAEGEPKQARIHLRGNHEELGEEVPRQFLAMLGGGELGDSESSGRRELAERIASADNPLTARVMVNRLWAWHFGRGLVATPNDFGNHGAEPSHPELLDYLAGYLIEHGWSVKALQRHILSSAAYQLAAEDDVTPNSFAASARRRLTAEELRDTLLVASGELDRTPGEAHPFPPEESWSFTQHGPFAAEYDTKKRSVYVMRKRNRTSRFFALFNGADPNASTAQREATTVPTQALYFMNDPFFHDCAAKFAVRIRESSTTAEDRLDFACRELFARPSLPEDVVDFREFANALETVTEGTPETKDAELWEAYARVLLASNELLLLD